MRSPTSDSLPGKCPSFVDALLFHALKDPHKPAIGAESGYLTFQQLADAILAATARCERAGLRPGSLVGLTIGDPIWHVCLIAALYRLGVASVSIGTKDGALSTRLGVAAVLHDGANVEGFPGSAVQVEPDWFKGPGSAARVAEAPFGESELCRVTLSSGTTGEPKPIALSPLIIWDRLTTYSLRGSFAASQRIYCGPQLRSQFGFAITFAALAYGKMVCFADSVGASVPVMSLYQTDLAIISVFQLSRLAEVLENHHGALSSLREIQAGGALISNALLNRARGSLNAAIVSTYASTEAGTVAFAPVERLGKLRAEGAVGFVTPWASVDICDEQQRVLPPGREGSLRVTALGLAPEFEPGMKTVSAREPFFPGDYGRLLSDGMLIVAGRTTEIINIGGNKLSPDRLEEVIMQCPGVRDAAVVVIEFNATLPQVWAAVVADANVDKAEISKRCSEVSFLATPAAIKIVDAIPRSSEGKILRDQLRKELTQAKA
jgi:acyl-coenzyme A synthetase/AMP-(fatty) acid ligase